VLRGSRRKKKRARQEKRGETGQVENQLGGNCTKLLRYRKRGILTRKRLEVIPRTKKPAPIDPDHKERRNLGGFPKRLGNNLTKKEGGGGKDHK